MIRPIFRFAPSPNGLLHLGHAYSALYNQKICKTNNGIMLLRMEDTDLARCSRHFEEAIVEDLTWIGFEWHGDIRRQSDQLSTYSNILENLTAEGLVYPAFMSRNQIRHHITAYTQMTGKSWLTDPDGAAHYPTHERHLDEDRRKQMRIEQPNHAWRLNIDEAQNWFKRQHSRPLTWGEMIYDQKITSSERAIDDILCEPQQWGDVVLGRKEIPASYHLASVIDDDIQNISHVVRGKDIFHATSIHRLLQEILDINAPIYCHHDLILDEDGKKYSKRHADTSLRALRQAGLQRDDIYKMIKLDT